MRPGLPAKELGRGRGRRCGGAVRLRCWRAKDRTLPWGPLAGLVDDTRGFSLIEMVVALVIFSLIGLIFYSLQTLVLAEVRDNEAEFDLQREARRTVRYFFADLTAAAELEVIDNQQGRLIFRVESESGEYTVEYRLEGAALIREVRDEQAELVSRSQLATGVTLFAIEFDQEQRLLTYRVVLTREGVKPLTLSSRIFLRSLKEN